MNKIRAICGALMVICLGATIAGCNPSDESVYYNAPPARVVQKKVLNPTRNFLSQDPVYTEVQLLHMELEHNILPAWRYATGKGVLVAIIDGGATTHRDIVEAISPKSYDFAYEDEDPFISVAEITSSNREGFDHFSPVTSILAARENDFGMCGVAPECEVLAVRVFDADMNTSTNKVADAIDYARLQGARVISLSLGTYYADERLYEATYRAAQAGIIVVAAAGNDGEKLGEKMHEPNHYPSGFSWVISVGASDINREGKVVKADFSNYGASVDIYARGAFVPVAEGFYLTRFGPTFGDFHGFGDGTSYSAPLVAGAIALALEIMPTLTREQALSALLTTADPIEGHGRRLMNIGKFLTKIADLAVPDELVLSDEPSLTDPPVGVPMPPLVLAALNGKDRASPEVLLSSQARAEREQSMHNPRKRIRAMAPRSRR